MDPQRIILLLLVLLAWPSGYAADESASPAEAVAHVRCWLLVPGESATWSVEFEPAGGDPELLFEGTPTKPVRGVYRELPAGAFRLTIRSGDTVLHHTEGRLEPDTLSTLLAIGRPGERHFQLLDDRTDHLPPGSCRIRLFNVGSDRRAIVDFAGEQRIDLAPESFETIEIAGDADVRVRMAVPDPEGYPALSLGRVNPRTAPSWSILVAPDYRGRFRPRISPDVIE